jgi:hypothetical protein
MTDRIKEYASYLLSIPDIATLTGMDEDELKEAIANKTSEISRAYHLGKAETMLAVRKQEVALAKAGSPFAIELMQSYMLDQIQHEE